MSYDVLIVEDDRDIRFYLELCFSEAGIRCLTTENGEVALKKLELLSVTELPAIAIVDVMMPVLDGPGFVEELQLRNLAPLLHVILTTSSLSAPKIEYYGRQCQVMSKPLDIDLLVFIIKQNIILNREKSVSL